MRQVYLVKVRQDQLVSHDQFSPVRDEFVVDSFKLAVEKLATEYGLYEHHEVTTGVHAFWSDTSNDMDATVRLVPLYEDDTVAKLVREVKPLTSLEV